MQNQQPVSCLPYPEGLFATRLPGAGQGGPMGHLMASGDLIARNALTHAGGRFTTSEPYWGLAAVSSPGINDAALPLYYGRASDPLYKLTSCRDHSAGSPYDPLGTYWHIPSGARLSGLQSASDKFFSVWDQTTDRILQIYQVDDPQGGTIENGTLAPCTATTEAEACPMFRGGYCAMADRSAGKDFLTSGGGGFSLASAPNAMAIRSREWMSGEIAHAIYLFTACESGTRVFPGRPTEGALPCADMGLDGTFRPPHGALFFVDYTDAQIDAMNLPAWQEPIIRALAHYGGYQGDTSGDNYPATVNPGMFESGEAYRLAGVENPIYKWLEQQGIGCGRNSSGPYASACTYAMAFFSGIPDMTGPNCPDVACGFLQHIHIADPCVARGMAGVEGGC